MRVNVLNHHYHFYLTVSFVGYIATKTLIKLSAFSFFWYARIHIQTELSLVLYL